MSIDKPQVVQQMCDRTTTISVRTDTRLLPDLPITVETHTEYDERLGATPDWTRVALSLGDARALQHALLTAINEAEKNGSGGAV